MKHPILALLSLVAAGSPACTTTTTDYAPLNPSPRRMVARPPEQVEVFSSGPPTRPHADVGLITVEEGDMSEGTPEYLVRLLRSAAAEKGCDGLVLAAPSSKSQSPFLTDRTSSYRVFSGTCIVYFAGR